ncbi:MAG: glycosyltransferase [Actinomycetota bacterium]
MQVLFSFVGGTGHAQPMVPVAQALRAAGHSVSFTGEARYLTPLRALGFQTLVAEGSPEAKPFRRLPLVPPNQDEEDRVLRELFATAIPRRRMPGYQRQYAALRPDLVVRDEIDFAAAVLTEKLDIPHAVVLVLAAGSFLRPSVAAEPLNALRAEHGLPPDDNLTTLARGQVLSPFPPGFRDPRHPLPPAAYSFRAAYSGGHAAYDLPGWWPRLLGGTPVVHVTLGTVALESGDLFERLLSGLAQLPVEVVAAVGRDFDPAELGPQPAHVHVERWVPQALLLPHTDVVVSHGGSGTVTAALAHGLPQIVAAMGADQLLNAARIEALHLGLSLHVETATAVEVRDTTAAVLADGQTRAAAQALQREYAALPGLETIVALLEALAG